jgi:hypothetical protein
METVMTDPHESLSREELLTLLDVYAKNWLAHDGCWFLAVEEAFGTGKAVEFDIRSWERFAPIEASRIKRAFDLPEAGGLAALDKALRLRLYARVNRQEIEWRGADTLVFRMVECRVQQARERKGLSPFPCKPVGVMEFTRFAETIDLRIRTRCITCPPDPVEQTYCAWEYTLHDESRPDDAD